MKVLIVHERKSGILAHHVTVMRDRAFALDDIDSCNAAARDAPRQVMQPARAMRKDDGQFAKQPGPNDLKGNRRCVVKLTET